MRPPCGAGLGAARPRFTPKAALDIHFDRGAASICVGTAAHGKLRAAGNIEGQMRAIYFKFGDYAQALDPGRADHFGPGHV